MDAKVTEELNKESSQSKLHEALLHRAKSCVKRSRSKMSKYYDTWDLQDAIYRGERCFDNEDMQQAEKGNPTKMTVPNTFAQCQVFISFLFLLFRQNRNFFELEPTGEEDGGTKRKDLEKVLEQNLRYNKWNTTLYQHLKDVAVPGIGVLGCEWTRNVARLRVQQPDTVIDVGGVSVNLRQGSEYQDFVKYEGNRVYPISPFRLFPDTDFPLTEIDKGDFCATEEEYTMSVLRTMQTDGEVAGVDFIDPLPNDWRKDRGGATRTIYDFDVTRGASGEVACGHRGKEGPVLVTKVKLWLVPKEFKYDGEKALGPEEHRVLYHVWYANDNKLIRVEPAEEWHNSFGLTVSQFTPDMHHTVSTGLANLVYYLQDVISWFINSHIKSVRQVIGNRLVVNVDAVETRSLDGEGDIYLKKGFGRRNVSEAVSQLNVSDVTGAHMNDVAALTSMMQLITGVNDNLQGAVNSGRRSALEVRNATAGAAGRMKLHGHLIWDTGLGPLAQLMTSNVRQSLSEDVFNRIIGQGALADPSRFVAFRGTPEEVIGANDYFTWDSTLQSEKGYMAQGLQELLGLILQSNPTAAMQISQNVDAVKLIDEIQYLRNGGSVASFRYAPGTQPPMPMMPQPGATA